MFAACLALVTGASVVCLAAPVFGLPAAACLGVGAAMGQLSIWDADDDTDE